MESDFWRLPTVDFKSMDDNPPPDLLEKGLRFGCGFFFGGAVVFFVLARWFFSTATPFWVAVVVCAVICGLLAVRFGDSFYHGIISFFRWFGGSF